jgi:hypothetical protein
MFDVVVLVEKDVVAAARTLASLVEGVVEGHLRRLVLVSSETSAELTALADQAGCRLEAGVPRGELGHRLAAHLTTPHSLVIAAGTLLEPGWTHALRSDGLRNGAVQGAQAVFFTPEDMAPRLKLRLGVALRRPAPVLHGVLASTHALLHGGFDGQRLRVGRAARVARVITGR